MGLAPSMMWSEFSQDDLDWLVAARAYEADIDPQTGMLLSEATSPGADPNNYDVPYRYVAQGHQTNWALKARLDAMDAIRAEGGEKFNMNGIFVPVEKVEFDASEYGATT